MPTEHKRRPKGAGGGGVCIALGKIAALVNPVLLVPTRPPQYGFCQAVPPVPGMKTKTGLTDDYRKKYVPIGSTSIQPAIFKVIPKISQC